MAAEPDKKAFGAGCVTLFALPFVGVGLVTFYLLVRELMRGADDLERLLLLAIFPPVFGGAGVAMILAARWAGRSRRAEAQLEQLHPDEPWRWNPDWTDGRIRGSNRLTMWFAWGFSLLWNLISAPLLLLIPEEVLSKGNYAALAGLLFPLVGVGLLWWAVRATLRYRRFGSAEFVMKTFPGVVGARLQGSIHTGLRHPPPGGVTVTLSSIHKIDRGGDSSDTERILWQDSYRLDAVQLQAGRRGLAIPVDFAIPPDAAPSDDSDPRSKKQWRLEVAAQTSGVDFHTQFVVPVFVTADSGDSLLESAFASELPAGRQEFDPAAATIRIGPSAGGGTEYYFPAARNKGAAVALTVFFLIFSGATFAMILWGLGDVFSSIFNVFFLVLPLGFGFVSLLLGLFMLDAWTGTSRVIIEDGRLRVRSTILGMGGWKEIECSRIADIKLAIGMQQTQTMTQSARAYYDIEVHPETGRKITLGRGLRDKREAEWLVEQLSLAVLD